MLKDQALARDVRDRTLNPDTLKQIAHTLKMADEGTPLWAEPDPLRRVRRVQAITGLTAEKATAVANYENLDDLDLTVAQRTGAESIQGDTVDFLGSSFLAKGALISRAVCRIALQGGDGMGTGFLISDRLLITNKHVIEDENAALLYVAEFDFEMGLNRQAKEITRFELDPDTFFVSHPIHDLDYTVVALGRRLSGQVTPQELGYCGLSNSPDRHSLGHFVNIIQHPEGRMKEVVVRESRLVARGRFALHYLADTEPGTSGAPVFNDEWEVVALHHWGVPHREVTLPDGTPVRNDVNEGIRISNIVQELKLELPKLSLPKQELLREALRLGDENRYAISGISEKLARTAGSGQSTTLQSASPGVVSKADGSVNIEVPLQIKISLGLGGISQSTATVVEPKNLDGGQNEPSGPSAGTGLAAGNGDKITRSSEAGKRLRKPLSDYQNREGYQPNFLPGFTVDMPALSAAQEAIAAINVKSTSAEDKLVLKYIHYSAILNAKRRLAFFTATNIDGASWKSVDRKTGAIDTGGEAREPWFEDPRLADDAETNDHLYIRQLIDGQVAPQLKMFQRGHLTRRQDPSWGEDLDIVAAADMDTFHFTNCTPQIGFFNEGKSNRASEAGKGVAASGILHWRAIEDFVLENSKAEKQRLCVFTGPVFDDAKDFPWRQHIIPGFLVPLEFWKVVIRVEEGKLRATALCADQSRLITQMPEVKARFKDLSKVDKYQIAIKALEKKTGLNFGKDLRAADTYVGPESGRSAPIADLGGLRL